MGGMAAAIPNRREPDITAGALEKVRLDKEREAGDGFDGSWVAHPDLVSICMDAFTEVLGTKPNQVNRQRDDVRVGASDLLDVAGASGEVTRQGLESNAYVGLAYITAWLGGSGAAAIRNLMEDVATAEISRSQMWQQIRLGVVTADSGETITQDLVRSVIEEQASALRHDLGEEAFEPHGKTARNLMLSLVTGESYEDFLTDSAYWMLPGVPEAP